MTAADLSGHDQLPWPCEFTCMGCGRKARGEFANHHWFKPRSWFERSDADGPQTVVVALLVVAVKGAKP